MRFSIAALIAATVFLFANQATFAQGGPCDHHLNSAVKNQCLKDHGIGQPPELPVEHVDPNNQEAAQPEVAEPKATSAEDYTVTVGQQSITSNSVTFNWSSPSSGYLSSISVESFCSGFRSGNNVQFVRVEEEPSFLGNNENYGTHTVDGLPAGCKVGVVVTITTQEDGTHQGLAYFDTPTETSEEVQTTIWPSGWVWFIAFILFFGIAAGRGFIEARGSSTNQRTTFQAFRPSGR